MAKNLNYLCNSLAGQKIMVWAANAHISKMEEEFMKGKVMGAEFLKLTNRKTYHVAFAPVKMPYRKPSFILSQAKESNNLLNLLPDVEGNTMILSELIQRENPAVTDKKYVGMFGMGNVSFDYFKHFDALVFIGNGEVAKF